MFDRNVRRNSKMEQPMRVCAAAVLLLTASIIAVPASAQSFTLVTAPTNAKILGLDAAGNRVPLGTGTAKIKLEKNSPNRFFITAEGFAPLDTVFMRDLKYPKSVTIALTTRIVRVTALPYQAEIRVNGKLRGTQNTDVEVPLGIPVTVEVALGGYKPEKRVYRNEPGVDLPAEERFELRDRQVSV